MFEWLEREIAAVKTPRFHVVDGPAGPELREAVLRDDSVLPASYKEFVLKFGNARLYRRPRNNSYQIGVFAAPRVARLNDRVDLYHVGFHDGATVYFKPMPDSAMLTICEFEAGSEERIPLDFEEWLRRSCSTARRAYSPEDWEEILRGPKPFTPQEEAVLEARRRIRWRVLGVDPKGDHIFEVHNLGPSSLPILTLGVRSKDRRLNGGIFLKLGDIAPGQTRIVHAACYKGLIAPGELEIFDMPDPAPEDREGYAELSDL
jgi:hypothetical protein